MSDVPKPRVTMWVPTTDLMTLRRLGKTCEELGELVAVLGRTICQGIDGVDPASGETNIERMTKESADVIAQIGCNVQAFQLDQQRIDARVLDKTEIMGEWEALFSAPAAASGQPADKAHAEIERLRTALAKANEQAERFERLWYLRGDALESIQAHCAPQQSALAAAIVATCDSALKA